MVPGDSGRKSLTQKLAEVWPRAGRGRRRHPRRPTVSDKIATRDHYISVHEAEEELQPQNRGRAIARVRGVGGSVAESMNAFGGRRGRCRSLGVHTALVGGFRGPTSWKTPL